MRKGKKVELDKEQIERIVNMAQEERNPFDVIKKEFGISENEVTEIMRKYFSKENFDLWIKKISSSKPKPKPQKNIALDDDEDLDSKYYLKNKFD